MHRRTQVYVRIVSVPAVLLLVLLLLLWRCAALELGNEGMDVSDVSIQLRTRTNLLL